MDITGRFPDAMQPPKKNIIISYKAEPNCWRNQIGREDYARILQSYEQEQSVLQISSRVRH